MRKVLLLGAAMLVSFGIMAQNAADFKLIGASNSYKQVDKNQKMMLALSKRQHRSINPRKLQKPELLELLIKLI